MFGILSQVQGWIKIKGSTNGTMIGNVTDKLKVTDEDSLAVLNYISGALGGSAGLSIFKSQEASISSRNETILSSTYTVPENKIFLITSFAGSYDAQAALYLKVQKQTGGSGQFVTLFRITMMSGGQGESTTSMNFGNGIKIASAGDVLKLTYEASIAKGTVWGEFSGNEV
jgi:hypothetical protein